MKKETRSGCYELLLDTVNTAGIFRLIECAFQTGNSRIRIPGLLMLMQETVACTERKILGTLSGLHSHAIFIFWHRKRLFKVPKFSSVW
jgi:hypothetical protein